MAIIASYVVPCEGFVLGWTLERLPSLRVDVQRMAAGESGVTPYFWARGDELDEFERFAAADPTVDGLQRIEERHGERLYRAEWGEQTELLTHLLEGANGSILSAVSTGETWTLRVLFPDPESLSAFDEYRATRDIDVELRRLYSASDEAAFARQVTEAQMEALALAFEKGYYRVPRESTLSELADELDISASATSKRLRRGVHRLLEREIDRIRE